jgi:hypothetical protein
VASEEVEEVAQEIFAEAVEVAAVITAAMVAPAVLAIPDLESGAIPSARLSQPLRRAEYARATASSSSLIK